MADRKQTPEFRAAAWRGCLGRARAALACTGASARMLARPFYTNSSGDACGVSPPTGPGPTGPLPVGLSFRLDAGRAGPIPCPAAFSGGPA